MAAKVKQMGIKDLKCDFNYQNLSDDKIKNCRQKYNENHIFFKTLDKIYEKLIDENKNLQNTPQMIEQIRDELKKSEEFDLEKDLVNTVSKNERLIRTQTDIVSENNIPKRELKVTEINMTSDLFVKEVEQNMSTFMLTPIEVDYQLIVRSIEDVSENFREKATVWDTKKNLNRKRVI